MAIKDGDGGAYKWIKATVRMIDKYVVLTYQISEPGVPQGRDVIDDPSCVDWTDDEVRTMAAQMLDVAEGKDEIEVIWN